MKPIPLATRALTLLAVGVTARAASPSVPLDLGEHAVLAAIPVHFAAPWPYDWMRGAAPLRDATLLTLRTEPVFATPRDALNPILMADATPVAVLWTSPRATCVVGLAPVVPSAGAPPATPPAEGRPGSPVSARLYWSRGDRLPEQIDVADASARYAEALLAGVPERPFPGGALAADVDDRALRALVTGAQSACDRPAAP
jgi:hypothetical protein